jgi:hypothetical protein
LNDEPWGYDRYGPNSGYSADVFYLTSNPELSIKQAEGRGPTGFQFSPERLKELALNFVMREKICIQG